MSKTTFEKQFLYRDEARIEASIEDFKRSLKRVNDMFPKVEKAINRELTDQEKINLATDKDNLLIDILKPKFPFPNADTAFNLQALGLNISALLNELQSLPGIFCKCIIDDGRLVIADETLDEIEGANTLYTQNENQNKALELAKKLIENIKEAEKMGFVNKFSLQNAQKLTSLINMPLGPGGLVPDRYTILNIQ